ncbi:MAG: hypothetical protein ALECFALPRED_006463 [Alectoria fallacina]|uniref:C2H2-type domain-containing protein n=1 Tax=Alectoria fallacina TaxID=1903189 RepID=A0A8H3EQL4_9LECA|nr:MAG: hypothetical protein ALECFALPRED_006463 [Alectoria fallacina]
MQKGAATLVRSPATASLYANQRQSFEDPNLIYSDLQPHTLPTLKQQAALTELLVFDDDKILAWLTILRSIEPGFRYRAGQGCLSNQQLDALSTLKDCSDSNILAWLTLSFLPSDVNRQCTLNDTISTSRFPVVSPSSHLRWPSTDPSLRSSNSSRAPSAVFSSHSSYDTPRSSLGYSTSLPELPEGTAYNDESDHVHWCTYGEHCKPIRKCEGWKRHEREHETPYLCMPHGPVEYTQHGRVCVLCHKVDPDADHLAKHNISICVGKFKEPLKKSRRTDMIKHLALHRVHSKVGAILADQWRCGFNKKYFSCGLCVVFFTSITDRWNHIDNEHWRHGQNMGKWELSNSIRGLLLETEVQTAWRVLLRSHPYLVESNLRWDMPLAEGLQLRLELSEEPGLVLANAALELSNYEWVRPSQEGLMAMTGREEMLFDPFSPASRSPTAATDPPLSISTYQSMPDHTQPRAPLSRLLPGSPASSSVEPSSTRFQNLQGDPPLTPSAFFNYQLSADDFRNDTFLYPGQPMDPNVSDIPSQLSTGACLQEWRAMDTSQPLDDKTRIQDRLSEGGALLVAQSSSPRHVHETNDATIDEQGPISDFRNDTHTNYTGRVPTSTFFHGRTAHFSKPLPPLPIPDLPGNASRAAAHRPTTPMDLGTG